MLQSPLTVTFKLFALAPQIAVTDAQDQLVLYVKQKLFKLKEDIKVCSDRTQTQQLYAIKADRIIDFSAAYRFTDAQNQLLGSVKRRGLRSIWRAHYDILSQEGTETPLFTIREENPWIKVLDGLLCEVPIVNFFTGFILNPVYLVETPEKTVVMRLSKIPTFLSRKFTIKQVDELDETSQITIILSLLMMVLLERNRG